MVFSTNGAGTTGICMQKDEVGPLLHITHKLTQNGLKT